MTTKKYALDLVNSGYGAKLQALTQYVKAHGGSMTVKTMKDYHSFSILKVKLPAELLPAFESLWRSKEF
jgi:hypothetical protein